MTDINTFLGLNAPGKIFVSYRREDTRWAAGRLFDSLDIYFGDGRVFRDIEGITGGADFAKVLISTLELTDAVVVLIGEDWLTLTDENGNRRIDAADDWVAMEIAAALKAQIPVYPVLVGDTPMPRADDLPDALKALARFNAITITDNRWDADIARLSKVLAVDTPSAAERKLTWLNFAVSISLFISIFLTTALVAIGVINQARPVLDFGYSGITFVVISFSAALLFTFAKSIDASRRKYFYASGYVGAFGTLLFFILLKFIQEESDESITMFFGSTVTATAMFVLMNLSGFKAK